MPFPVFPLSMRENRQKKTRKQNGELQQQVAIVLTSDDLCEGGLFFWREG